MLPDLLATVDRSSRWLLCSANPLPHRSEFITGKPIMGLGAVSWALRAQMAYQDSAQSFVRALRAPTDPPRPGDPQKIDIATATWRETSFHVPRKAEIILEWCLTRLLKDGTRQS
jgi:hypothetical protein